MKKIGIIGGGQLARMMCFEAKRMGFHVTVLDPTPKSPAGQVADEEIVADFFNRSKIEELVKSVDVTTFDLENIDVQVLKTLDRQGYEIHPSPYVLEIIQDKLTQKEFLRSKGIPVAEYRSVCDLKEDIKQFGFPVVQKMRRGGYDGRGVFILRNEKDLQHALKGETYLEEFIQIEKEIAVIVARNKKGETACYPVVEMYFDENANICQTVIVPARISERHAKLAQEIAMKVIEVFEAVGVFGIEMFLTKSGQVLVNEIAPRPHNSGHYSIEACVTSQFEQHIRAITDLPLGSTRLLSPAVMVNLLGEVGCVGRAKIKGLEEALSVEGLSFHFYGKQQTWPYRKMGHYTVLDEDVERALEKALRVREFLKVVSEEEPVCLR
ncbi:5-(carboxyamino)imidazole ribonucleotide synthase [Pseudothermotoga sp.]